MTIGCVVALSDFYIIDVVICFNKYRSFSDLFSDLEFVLVVFFYGSLLWIRLFLW